jgi:hypothetical protein
MQVSCHNDLPIASRPLSRQVIVHCETMMTMSDIGGTVTAGWFRPSSGRIPCPCQFTKGLLWSHRASAIKYAFVRTFQDRVSWVSRDDRYSGRDRFLNGIAIEMNYWKPTLDPRSYWIRNRRQLPTLPWLEHGGSTILPATRIPCTRESASHLAS